MVNAAGYLNHFDWGCPCTWRSGESANTANRNRSWPEVSVDEVGVSRRETGPTDGCLPFLTKRQMLCDKARARIFGNLHLFTLCEHTLQRDFSLWTAR
jgi:hypothetical protein